MSKHTVFRNVVGFEVIYFGNLSSYKEGDAIPMIVLRKRGVDTLDFKWTSSFIANASVAIGEIPNYMFVILFAQCIKLNQNKFSDANLIYLTDNYRKAFMTAKLEAMAMVIDHITTQGMKRIEMMDYLHEIKQFGFNTPELTGLYNNLRNCEVENRFQNQNARIIQRRYREAIANPNTELCKQRLIHEFEEFESTFA